MTRVRLWAYPIVMGVMGVGVAVNFALLIPLIDKVTRQSTEGRDARVRQQAVYPVSVKLYTDAERRGVISARELACFKDSSKCPPTARKNP